MTTLVFDPSARSLQGGRVLIGGHPGRLLRLTPAGARMVAAWRAGAPVGAGTGARVLADRLIDAGLAHPRPTGCAVSPDDVAVVIPVRDRLEDLAACLARVGPCREIVVVDDGSATPIRASSPPPAPPHASSPPPAPPHASSPPPGAAPPRASSPPPVRVLRRDVSGGPAAARNDGVAATDAPFVAFLDSDTLPSGGWLEPLLAHFGDPRVAAVAPRVRVPAGRSALARYEATRSPLDLGSDPGIVGPGRRIGYVPAAALVVRRAALLAGSPPPAAVSSPPSTDSSPAAAASPRAAVSSSPAAAVSPRAAVSSSPAGGPFDPSMRFGEDVDLVWRLAASGWTVRYEPASVVEHPQRATLRAWLRQRAAYGSSAGPLARRHPGKLRHVVVAPDALLPWALALAGRPRLALLAALPRDALRRRAPAPAAPPHDSPPAAAPPTDPPHDSSPAAAPRDLALLRLSLEARARAARQIADAAWRAHAPLLATSRRGRRFLAGALLVGATADYATRRPALDPVRFTALRVADDLAYAAGLWAGCLRARTLTPLMPEARRRRSA